MHQDPDFGRLQAYANAIERAASLGQELLSRLRAFLLDAEGHGPPTLKDLAFLEAFRADRDRCIEELRRLENELFTEVIRRLPASDPTDAPK